MATNSQDSIDSLVSALHAEYPLLPREPLARHLADVVKWNDRIGLVSKRATMAALGRLVRHSAQLFEFVRRKDLVGTGHRSSVVDVGSGAGFPGLVWKLMEPALSVTLVERRQKKATFLQRAVVVLGLDGVEVVEGDAVEIATYERLSRHFHVATSLAVGAPDAIARLVEPFLEPGGHFCTLRPSGESTTPERIGKQMSLVAVSESKYGRYALYRRAPVGPADTTP